MAKVGKKYRECGVCNGDGQTSSKAHGHTPIYSNCKNCTQGDNREAPKGMVIVEDADT